MRSLKCSEPEACTAIGFTDFSNPFSPSPLSHTLVGAARVLRASFTSHATLSGARLSRLLQLLSRLNLHVRFQHRRDWLIWAFGWGLAIYLCCQINEPETWPAAGVTLLLGMMNQTDRVHYEPHCSILLYTLGFCFCSHIYQLGGSKQNSCFAEFSF